MVNIKINQHCCRERMYKNYFILSLCLVFIFLSFPSYSQDISFFDYDWETAIDTTWGEGAPTEEKLATFDSIWTIIDEKYGAFHNLDTDWDSIRSKYRPEIVAGVSQGRFVAIINHMGLSLKDSHTHFLNGKVGNTVPNPKTPIIYTGGWGEDRHFGAGLSPLPDSSLLVCVADENHPLGLEAGDIIIGYEGVPWKELYKILLDMEFPLGIGYWGSNEKAFAHWWLTGAGKNWHLFNTIDIVKYGSSDTLHLPTSLMEDAELSAIFSEQIPIEGIPYLDEISHHEISWGLVEDGKVGYVYIWSWFGQYASQDLFNAIDSLINVYQVEGLILDMRANTGGYVSYSYRGLDLLFSDTSSYVGLRFRGDPEDRYDMREGERFTVRSDSTHFYHKPIAVLTSPLAVSAADIIAYMLRDHPSVQIFGKTTATSFSSLRRMTFDGWLVDYSNSNGYSEQNPDVYLSRLEFPVDHEIGFLAEDVRNGVDTIVKEAISWINDQIATPIFEPSSHITTNYRLYQNYPNPFNPITTIEFDLPKSEFVTIKVYNILGEEIATVINDKLQVGHHTYAFDGSNFASGMYVYRIEAGEFQQVRKMVLIK